MSKDPYWMSEEEYSLVTNKSSITCIDLIILRNNQKVLETLLLKRKIGYEKGKWCIIGGRRWKNEVAEETIDRQAKDLNIKVEIINPFNYNFPAWVNDNLKQDKTKHPVSSIYPVRIASGNIREEGEEYMGYNWFPVDKIPKMAYDHKFDIIKVVEQLRKFGNINKV